MITYILLGLWSLYTALFLLFLIYRFANFERHQEIHDELLGKKVPTMVYVMNQNLARENLRLNIEYDESKKQRLKLSADINEHMFYVLRKNGIAATMDEAIGSEFVNFQKMRLEMKSDPNDCLISSFVTQSAEFSKSETNGTITSINLHSSLAFSITETPSFLEERQFREAVAGHIRDINDDPSARTLSKCGNTKYSMFKKKICAQLTVFNLVTKSFFA